MVSINYLAVILSAVSSMVVGFLWFGPVFGKTWMTLMGFTKEKMAAMPNQKEMGKLYAIQFLGSLFMAYVLSHSIVFANFYLGTSGIYGGLMAGFWNWLGFVAPVTLGSVLWEGKSWKLWCFNNSYYLVMLLVMGVILSLWA